MNTALVLILSALISYFFGCANGSILVSKIFFHEDIRKKGSGNAGLTNFYRTYGVKCVGFMLAIDILKTVLAMTLGGYLFSRFLGKYELGQYWSALFVVLGHCLPCMFSFRGGKGILCSGTMLVLLDWRIALVGFGFFIAALVLTRYVSLGSVLAALSFPFTTWWVYSANTDFMWLMLIAVFLASFVIWSHRSNLVRLLTGKENKFFLHSKKEK